MPQVLAVVRYLVVIFVMFLLAFALLFVVFRRFGKGAALRAVLPFAAEFASWSMGLCQTLAQVCSGRHARIPSLVSQYHDC